MVLLLRYLILELTDVESTSGLGRLASRRTLMYSWIYLGLDLNRFRERNTNHTSKQGGKQFNVVREPCRLGQVYEIAPDAQF